MTQPSDESTELNDWALPVVNFDQAIKLDYLGFDWPVYKRYQIQPRPSIGFNKTGTSDSESYVKAPTVALALRWVRKKYKIFHESFSVSWSDEHPVAFSVAHSIEDLKMIHADISNGASKRDGVMLDYDDMESNALSYALNYLINKEINEDKKGFLPGDYLPKDYIVK